jgi:hypothetical protein
LVQKKSKTLDKRSLKLARQRTKKPGFFSSLFGGGARRETDANVVSDHVDDANANVVSDHVDDANANVYHGDGVTPELDDVA